MKPEPGITIDVKVTNVPDGDTITVEFKRKFNVRVKDFLAGEKRTHEGKEHRKFAQQLLAESKMITVFIPTNNNEKLLDFLSFERVVGDIWLEDGRRFDDVMHENKMGRKLLPGEKPHTGT